jgi:hypothetical protein
MPRRCSKGKTRVSFCARRSKSKRKSKGSKRRRSSGGKKKSWKSLVRKYGTIPKKGTALYKKMKKEMGGKRGSRRGSSSDADY